MLANGVSRRASLLDPNTASRRHRRRHHRGRSITVDGRPALLAVVLDDRTIAAAGEEVACEFESVAVDAYRKLLQGRGYVRVIGDLLPCSFVVLDHAAAIISAVSHEGPTVTVKSQPAQFVIVSEDGSVVAAGGACEKQTRWRSMLIVCF